MTSSAPATKQDLSDLYNRTEKMVSRVVGDVVGGIVGDALQIIMERFDKIDSYFDRIAKKD